MLCLLGHVTPISSRLIGPKFHTWTHSCPQSARSFPPVVGIALAWPDFLSMCRVFVSYSQLLRFAKFDGKAMNHGLLVLNQARALDPCHRPEGSWTLGTRMTWTDNKIHPVNWASPVTGLVHEEVLEIDLQITNFSKMRTSGLYNK